MNTTKNNKIIAKFMGLTIITDGISYFDTHYNPLKKYSEDWNQLMEVVEKIYTLDLYYDKYIEFNSSMFSNGKIELSTRIYLVYNQCVEFIKWYNEQNK
jgi:hypothetical protein